MTASLMPRFCGDSAMRVVTKPFPDASIPLIPTTKARWAETAFLSPIMEEITEPLFEHELQLRWVITAGYDLRAAKPRANQLMLRGMSTRRRSYSSASQL